MKEDPNLSAAASSAKQEAGTKTEQEVKTENYDWLDDDDWDDCVLNGPDAKKIKLVGIFNQKN